MMHEIHTHQRHDTAPAPQGITGWLLLLSLLLIVWGPINAALVAATALPLLQVRGPSLGVGLVALTLVTAFGVAAGMALFSRRPSAVSLAKAALILSAAMDLVVYVSPYFPSNRMPGDTPIYVVVSLFYHAAWLAYLFRSKRVRNTY